jgi:protein-L-isoaspartate(D-aspartate) O-methyltransferase
MGRPMTNSTKPSIEDCRRFYAQEIRWVSNLASPALVEALARVPREKFLGASPWQIGSAEQRSLSLSGMVRMNYTPTEDPRDLYHNVLVALDIAKDINNGQPSALARWIDALDLKSGDRAYHLGCGVGYYTALMAEVVGPAGSVVGIDANADLAARAKENFAAYAHGAIHAADGATFDPGECDAILVNAGVTHPHPLWLDRLRDGGRLVVPITMAATPTLGQGVMIKITRRANTYAVETVTMLAIFSGVGMRDPLLEPLMQKALTTGGLLKLKSIRRDAHESTDSCVLHGREVCLSTADPAAAQQAAG